MKLFFLLNFILLFSSAHATNYYISSSGNDANSGASTSVPWKTITKFNSVFASLKPGDNVLFNRGDIFYGSITISRSGSSGSPITIGAYGTGANPIITGFTTQSSWRNIGGNIWESTSEASKLATCNMVVINGVNTPIGRYPNTGYLSYQSFVGNTKITSSSLTGSINWTGAEAVIRKQRWIIDRNFITAQSGGALTYKPSSTYNGKSNYGFFIQNDSRTLDQNNEWYYNPSTKKISIYSNAIPTNVQVATRDTLALVKLRSYITFDNLTFLGANKNAFVILSSNNITIQNCNIDFTGIDAIWGNQNWGRSSGNFTLKNSNINHTNNNAIILADEFTNALISHNVISNSGMIVGMGGSGDGMCVAIQIRASNAIIEYNEIINTGYMGIQLLNNNIIVRNNLINGFCLVKLDGAGIYTWVGIGRTPFTGQKVLNNIVLNGIGNNAGTNATGASIAHGIYIDDGSANVEVAGNSTANCSHTGLYIHNAQNLNIHDNTSFNNGLYQLLVVSFDVNKPVRNDKINNNIFVSRDANQYVGSFKSRYNDLGSFGDINNNYYARPMDDNVVFELMLNNYTTFYKYTLAQWKPYSGQDANSNKSPKTITDVNDLRFEYNATTSSKTIPLDGNYIDVKNVSYNGTITLAPYTSAVLIRNGATTNQPPTAQAGNDQTITLPTSIVNLSGSGTDPDGYISSYNWTKNSGPTVGTISNASAALTTVTGLGQGVYQFKLEVTGNKGAKAMDTVQVMVINASAGSLLPAVNPANTINGLDYKYYEGNGYSVVPPNYAALTPKKTGTTTNFNLSLANRLVVFSFNFTGYINVPSDGNYTFYTTSDDGSKLYIDNILVANNDGLHGTTEKSGTIGLKAGKHAISVGYIQQGGGSLLTVNYSGPGVSKQAVPQSALYRVSLDGLLPAVNPANTINGLDYKYYEGNGYSVVPPNYAALTPKKTGTTTNFNLSLANRLVVFSFNFTGYINVPSDGNYTFYTTSDDGSKLYIDNILVANNDGLHGTTEKSGTIGLKAGKHAISVGYIQQGGGSLLTVNYSGPGVSKQIVPASSLYRISGAVNNLISGRISSYNQTVTDQQTITPLTENGIKAYPNPFINSIIININGEAGEYKLLLVDGLGRILWVKNGHKNGGAFKQSINTSALKKGIYFLKALQNNNSSVIKLEK